MEIVLRPVGVVRTHLSDEEVRNSLSGVSGVVEVYEEYEEGLEGIDGFSHIILITYLHKVTEEQKKVLKVRGSALCGHCLIFVPLHPARVFIGLGGVRGHPKDPTS